ILGMIKKRFFSFTLVIGIGFLLLVSLVISAGISALSKFAEEWVPGVDIGTQVINFVLSFGITMFLFGMMYRILPDVEIAWKDVWLGAAMTSLLFTIGKFLIGLYLGQSSAASTYGAAGSLVVLLIWIYYSAQIVLLGAEFTQVYADKYGSTIVPNKNARVFRYITEAPS
ncbi:MAG: YihY/virulence factor BrkB family protein, partial [Anaerolineae bacterium]|nr:YihY/virulence factor BrkB family protein [Anaerolineae bacterium]